jgi:DNA-binding LacI/PurR family transcriptional regulator
MGRILWERLGARIRGDASPARHVLLPCELKLRDSTAPPPKPAPRPVARALSQ